MTNLRKLFLRKKAIKGLLRLTKPLTVAYTGVEEESENQKLSEELWLRIFGFLNFKELFLLGSLTSKRWSRLTGDNSLWKKHFRIKFPEVKPSILKGKVPYRDIFRRRCGGFVLDCRIVVGSGACAHSALPDGAFASGLMYDAKIIIWDV